MKKITFIKLGGSIVTDKSKPEMVRTKVLNRLIEEINQYTPEKDEQLIVGHGAGSFAHVPAKKFHVMDGFSTQEGPWGMALTHDSASRLNRIVVSQFLKQNKPAISFSLSQNSISHNKKKKSIDVSVLHQYLNLGLLPITFGDVIVDDQIGCTVWSTERVFSELIDSLKNTYQINRVIHVTDVDGLLSSSGDLIKLVDSNNYTITGALKKRTKGDDVTGGMHHKIEESIQLAKIGIKSFIISGLKTNNLFNCLNNKTFVGTKIS